MSKLTRKQREYKLLLLKEKAKRTAKDDFWRFCLYMDYDFFKAREEILKSIAREMQRLIKPLPGDTELDILNISLPPRSGKSYLTSLLCAWCFGFEPSGSIMRNSVTTNLYLKFSKDIRAIMQSKKYLEIFPDIKFKTSSVEMWELENSKQGISYFGGGVEKNITGFGANLLSILDDSIKDEFDALNENSLDKKWSWYGSVMKAREEKGVKKLFIGTRWSKHDIVGRLEEEGFFNRKTSKNIIIPALINNKTFCENVHTTAYYVDVKKITSRLIWLAEFMQHPIEAEGLLFPPHELKYFKTDFLEGRKIDAVIAWGDVADEGKDYFAYPVGYLIGSNVYIKDVVFTQEKIEVSKNKIVKATIDNNIELAYFESNNGGKGYALEVARLLKDMGSKTVVGWQPNRQNKETRILVGSEIVKNNFYFLDRGEYEEGSEYDLFMKQFTSYSHLGKNAHDDAADSLNSLKDLYLKIISNRQKKKKPERSGLI